MFTEHLAIHRRRVFRRISCESVNWQGGWKLLGLKFELSISIKKLIPLVHPFILFSLPGVVPEATMSIMFNIHFRSPSIRCSPVFQTAPMVPVQLGEIDLRFKHSFASIFSQSFMMKHHGRQFIWLSYGCYGLIAGSQHRQHEQR